jgi:hypothetical protein
MLNLEIALPDYQSPRGLRQPTSQSHCFLPIDIPNNQDFRDLILWMLDDTTYPEWIEIRHKSHVRGCVVLLVPGLSPQTFSIEPTHGSEGKRMRRLREINPSPLLPNITEIFEYVWLPRAPGTNTQLYSPLQAFLNCPLTSAQNLQRAKELSNRKGVKLCSRLG